jgi:hypothetical protein
VGHRRRARDRLRDHRLILVPQVATDIAEHMKGTPPWSTTAWRQGGFAPPSAYLPATAFAFVGMRSHGGQMSRALRNRTRNVFLLASAFIGYGSYQALRPEQGNAHIALSGCSLIASVVLVALASTWLLRARRARTRPIRVQPTASVGLAFASAVIRIERPLATADDPMRLYRVQVDDVTVGALRFGEYLDLPVAPGSHTLHAYFHRWGSPTVRFRITDGERVIFTADASKGSTMERRSRDPIVLHRLT